MKAKIHLNGDKTLHLDEFSTGQLWSAITQNKLNVLSPISFRDHDNKDIYTLMPSQIIYVEYIHDGE